ncbi:MAG: hypothetical protein DHS20C14_02420 [Phycisphaeraceae bacterium]|nr:MAG: hypothetical protein DHS20C14_02420 [Phycisphaeraceae bacterium]
MPEDTPKIIVDDDWKSQAQAEKEKLAAQDAQAKAEGPGAGPGGLPEKLTFDDLIKMLATQALMYLGAFPDPQTGKAMIALDLAKLHIDMLGLMQDKTKGNLSDDEKSMLDGTVHELRLQFAEIVKAVEKAKAEGKLDASGGGAIDLGGGPPGM